MQRLLICLWWIGVVKVVLIYFVICAIEWFNCKHCVLLESPAVPIEGVQIAKFVLKVGSVLREWVNTELTVQIRSLGPPDR